MLPENNNISPQVSNNKKELLFKRLLFSAVFLVFLLLLLQQLFQFSKKYKVEKLDGYFVPKNYVPVTSESWFNGDYQKTTDEFLNANFGFRNLFVRANNQLKFLLFNKTSAFGVIIGKENYLYEINYLNAYNRIEYIGDKAINDTIRQIKTLQDTLKHLGKELLVVLCPSKARIYPEFIPNDFIEPTALKSYYEAYSNGFKKSGINYIDFNNLFSLKKEKSKELLIPQLGIHWSRLEAIYAADTIINYLSQKSLVSLPRIKITSVNKKDELVSPDDDIVKSMNLLWYPSFQKMSYALFDIDSINRTKKNALVIADSYWWDIYLQDIPKNVFANNEFWYYNKEMWGNNYLGKTDPKNIDIKRKILQNDYIIIVVSESNYDKMGFGFISSALNCLRRAIKPTPHELEEIKTAILKNSEWVDQIKVKAENRKITFDSLLIEDANWRFQHKGPLNKSISREDVKATILNNSGWMEEIKAKASSRGITIEDMIEQDVDWYMLNVLKIPLAESKPVNKPTNYKEVIGFIKKTPEWMNQINEKAKKRGLSVDSMITLDAIWYMKENHIK